MAKPFDLADYIWPDLANNRQPSQYSKINLPGLIAGSCGHFNRDVYNNADISIVSNVSKSIDKYRAFAFNGSQSGSDYLYSGASERCNGATSLLAIATFKRHTMAGSQQIISEWGDVITNERWLLYSSADGSILFGTQGSIDGTNVLVKSSAAGIISANTWHTIAAYWDAATNSLTVYVDGENVPITTNIWVMGTVTSLMTPTTSSGLVLGYQYTGADSKLTGDIAFAAISVNAKFNTEELKSYSDNPWQLLNTPQDYLYFTPAVAPVDLSGASVSAAAATGGLTSAVPLVGAAVSTAAATGAVTITMPLSGSATATASSSGDTTTAMPLAGSAASISIANGNVTLSMTLAGAAVAAATASGALAGGTDLSGSATSDATGSGALTSTQTLSGSAAATSAATGSLSGDNGLSGLASATGSATGSLTLTTTLSGSALSQALASSGLTSVQPLTGLASAASSAMGALEGLSSGALAGNAQGQGAAAGQLLIDVPISGAATASVAGMGNVTAIVPIAGSSAAIVNAAGDLTVSISTALAGNALAQVLAGGDIRMTLPMSGAALAQAIATAAATVSGLAIFTIRKELTINRPVMALTMNYQGS